MIEEDNEARGLTGWVRARMHVIIGIGGLIAWLTMLWLMFGDVL